MSKLTDTLKARRREVVEWMGAVVGEKGKKLDAFDAKVLKTLDTQQAQIGTDVNRARVLELTARIATEPKD
jgi:hypothetical protein